MKVRVELADPPAGGERLVGLKDVEVPDTVEAVRLTEPVNPPVLVTVIVDGAEPPVWILRVDGLALIIKSG